MNSWKMRTITPTLQIQTRVTGTGDGLLLPSGGIYPENEKYHFMVLANKDSFIHRVWLRGRKHCFNRETILMDHDSRVVFYYFHALKMDSIIDVTVEFSLLSDIAPHLHQEHRLLPSAISICDQGAKIDMEFFYRLCSNHGMNYNSFLHQSSPYLKYHDGSYFLKRGSFLPLDELINNFFNGIILQESTNSLSPVYLDLPNQYLNNKDQKRHIHPGYPLITRA